MAHESGLTLPFAGFISGGHVRAFWEWVDRFSKGNREETIVDANGKKEKSDGIITLTESQLALPFAIVSAATERLVR